MLKQLNRDLWFKDYFEWSKYCVHIRNVCTSRSGGHWLRGIVKLASGRPTYGLSDVLKSGRLHEVETDRPYFHINWAGWGVWPDDNYKHLVLLRDPRDIILSNCHWAFVRPDKDKGKEKDLFDDMEYWRKRCNDIMKYIGGFFFEKDHCIVQYEMLALDPDSTVKRILEYMEYEQVMSGEEAVKKLDTKGQRNPAGGVVRDNPYEFESNYHRYCDHSQNWKKDHKFTKEHNELVWDEIGEYMVQFGYLKHGHNLSQFM